MDLKLGIASNFLGNNGFIAASLDDGTSYSIPRSMFAAVSPNLLPSRETSSQVPQMIQPMHYPNIDKTTFDCAIQWICTGDLPAELLSMLSSEEDAGHVSLIAVINIHNFALSYNISKLAACTLQLALTKLESTPISPQITLAALSNYKPSDVTESRSFSTCTPLQEAIVRDCVEDFLEQDVDPAALDELARVPGFFDLFLSTTLKYYNVTRKDGVKSSTQDATDIQK